MNNDYPKKALAWVKSTWNLLFQGGVVISTFAASLLLPLAPGVAVGEADPAARVVKFATYIITVVLGLSLIVTRKLNKKRHLRLWVVLTVVFLGSSVYAIYRNYQLNNSLTCLCNGKTVLKGKEYKQPEVINRFFPNGVDCSSLCKQFQTADGKVVPERVWTEDSMNESRRILFISYLLCFPLVALTIISVVQAIFCGTR